MTQDQRTAPFYIMGFRSSFHICGTVIKLMGLKSLKSRDVSDVFSIIQALRGYQTGKHQPLKSIEDEFSVGFLDPVLFLFHASHTGSNRRESCHR